MKRAWRNVGALAVGFVFLLMSIPGPGLASGGILGNDPHYGPVAIDGPHVTCHRLPAGSCTGITGAPASPLVAQIVSFHNDCGVTPQPIGCPGAGGPGVAYLVVARVLVGGVPAGAPTDMLYWQCIAAGSAPIPGTTLTGGLFTGRPNSDGLPGALTTQGSLTGGNSYGTVPPIATYIGDWAKTPSYPAPGALAIGWFPQAGPAACATPCFPIGGPCLALPNPQHTDVF